LISDHGLIMLVLLYRATFSESQEGMTNRGSPWSREFLPMDV